MKIWFQHGYDSAWSATGVIGEREENCVRDPTRIHIQDVLLGNTGEARRARFEVRSQVGKGTRLVHIR